MEGRRRVYHGESHRTLYERSKEHWEGLRDQTEDSVLHRHWREEHRDRETAPEYSIKIKHKCRSSTERQVRESLAIEGEESTNLINNKSEWGQNPVPRQATEFMDKPWGDRRDEDGTKQRHTERQHRETGGSEFSSQYSQRRRAMREEKKRAELELEARSQEDPRDATEMTEGQGETEGLQQPDQKDQQPQRKKRKRATEIEMSQNPESRTSQRNIRDMFYKVGTSDLVQ